MNSDRWPGDQPSGVRLQKVLAAAGLGSRRVCEELIAQGRVTVDGHVAILGARVDPETAEVRVDGNRVNLRGDLVYLALNKPRGVVSAMSDPQGRPDLSRYVAGYDERLFHVGRLDAETEGLLILTNDGEFANRLAHPSHGVVKVYVAEVEGQVAAPVARQLRDGITLEDGPVAVDGFRILDAGSSRDGGRSLVEVSLHEGRKHIVRRLLAEVGHPVLKLVRTAVGPVRLGDQRQGTVRPLSRQELTELYRQLGL
ncbi:rRNA pseudouridine synthase [Jatrophihabitans telluris]|uniref:Pseudouridine synthase n=1 Tax=Jatrophihabitans telluris TaxID=2038343 RepID=A0ABY4R2S4_9ACTN|nr:pseudouridine synthase [Jatrophihabitans telluris]UQX90125.1 rRNA pseudouridine synthase [Jatrophihabitans telluris]